MATTAEGYCVNHGHWVSTQPATTVVVTADYSYTLPVECPYCVRDRTKEDYTTTDAYTPS